MLALQPRYQDIFHGHHDLTRHPDQSYPTSAWQYYANLDDPFAAPATQPTARVPRQLYSAGAPTSPAHDIQAHHHTMTSLARSLQRSQQQHQQQQQQQQQPPIRVHLSSPAPDQPELEPSTAHAGSWQSHDADMSGLGQGSLDHRGSNATGTRNTAHQRVQSGSSIASTGPASPFDPVVSQPYIVSDVPVATSVEQGHLYDDFSMLEQAKPLPTPSHTPLHKAFLMPEFHYRSPATTASSMADEQDHSRPRSTLSHTHSRSTSSTEHHPLTPVTIADDGPETEAFATTRAESTAAFDAWTGHARAAEDVKPNIPKLDRTMTDAYEDELYRPGTYAPAPCTPPAHQRSSSNNSNNQDLLSPYRNLFSERLQAANQAHLLEARDQSPVSALSRERSPFRQGSRFAPSPAGFEPRSPHARSSSVMSGQVSQSLDGDGEAAATHAPSSIDEDEALRAATISPRDAVLEFDESDEQSNLPLFSPQPLPPPPPAPALSSHSEAVTTLDHQSQHQYHHQATTPSISTATTTDDAVPIAPIFNFIPPPSAAAMPTLRIPQQYPFVPHPRRNASFQHQHAHATDANPEFPAHLTSMETSMSESAPESSGEVRRPAHTSADTGTYTCTYHGCRLRFETPAKLQKHKREGHRQHNNGNTTTITTSATAEASSSSSPSQGMTTSALQGQAGPHRCDRINPITGRPCQTIFSRPYDLTRHEDTIHNARKIKARCAYCTEEKTFSRHDALTRHMRVVHPEIEFGARARRRRGGRA